MIKKIESFDTLLNMLDNSKYQKMESDNKVFTIISKYCGCEWIHDSLFASLMTELDPSIIDMINNYDLLPIEEKYALGDILTSCSSSLLETSQEIRMDYNVLKFQTEKSLREKKIGELMKKILNKNNHSDEKYMKILGMIDRHKVIEFRKCVSDMIDKNIGHINIGEEKNDICEEFETINAQLYIRESHRKDIFASIIDKNSMLDEEYSYVVKNLDRELYYEFEENIESYLDGKIDYNTLLTKSIIIDSDVERIRCDYNTKKTTIINTTLVDEMFQSYLDEKLIKEYGFNEIIDTMDRKVVKTFRQHINNYLSCIINDEELIKHSETIEREKQLVANKLNILEKAMYVIDKQYLQFSSLSTEKIKEIRTMVKEDMCDETLGENFLPKCEGLIMKIKKKYSNETPKINIQRCQENDEINKVVDHFLGKNKYPKYFQTIKSKIDASDIEYIKLIVKSFYDKMIKFPKLLYNVSHVVEKVDNIYLSIIKSESLDSIHNTAKLSPDIEGSVCASQNNTTHDEDRFGDKYEYKSHSTSLSDYPKKRQSSSSSSSSSRNSEDK